MRGAVGARPEAFNTVRYSEKIWSGRGSACDIMSYAPAPGVPAEKLVQMAKLGLVLSRWMDAHAIDATAIQCWTSVRHSLSRFRQVSTSCPWPLAGFFVCAHQAAAASIRTLLGFVSGTPLAGSVAARLECGRICNRRRF
jgi:hypothetical protein